MSASESKELTCASRVCDACLNWVKEGHGGPLQIVKAPSVSEA